MKVDVIQGEELKRTITVVVEAEKVNDEMNRQYIEVRKKTTLKGYRKGKAPLEMIKTIYKDEVTGATVDALLKATYPDAIRESKLKVATPPTVTNLDFTDDGSMTYSADVEIFPELGTIKFDGLKVKTGEIEVLDSDVDDIVEMYRVRFSDLREVTRPVEAKDVIVADLKKLEDTKNIMKEDSFEGVEIDLGKEQTVKEFREQLVGQKAGDEREIEVAYADDYSDERFAGAKIRYMAHVKAVKERILPEFDDALAKQSQQAETALELKLKIREQLTKERGDVLRNNQKQEIIGQLIEKNHFLIPEAMIKEYLDAAVADVKKQHPEANEDEIRESYREPGKGQMRWNFLYHELAEQEKIEVLPSDTEKWIEGFAQGNNVSPEQAKQMLAQDGRGQKLKESLLEEKVLDFLLEGASKDKA